MFGDGPTTWHGEGHCVNAHTCLAAADRPVYCLLLSLLNTHRYESLEGVKDQIPYFRVVFNHIL